MAEGAAILMRRLMWLVALAAVLAALPLSVSANPACDVIFKNRYKGNDVVRLDVEGVRTLVLLPNDYASGSRSYPTVYLLPGGISPPDDYLLYTDLRAFTLSRPADRQAIVVLVDFIKQGVFIDWHDGRYQGAKFFVETLIPTIDRTFRTIADGRHRAIAAYSYPNFGSTLLAAQHPEMFAALATFSGAVGPNETDPVMTAFVPPAGIAPPLCNDQPTQIDPFGVWGDPITDALWWHDGSAVDLAPNLRGMRVDVFAQHFGPCDARDVVESVTDHFPFPFVERWVEVVADRFVRALTDASVDHRYMLRPCGVHTYRYVEQDIHDWWEPMFAAFGRPVPSSFDFRRATSRFSQWGWSFQADPSRAAEFLDVADASANGVTLTGSGVATVTTAVFFAPGAEIALTGAQEASAIADEAGRITFHVDLGPAHRFQQFTIPARALEALGDYWTTRVVKFGSS